MQILIFWAIGIAIAFYIIAPKEIIITENEQAKILFPNAIFWMEVAVKTIFILSGWLTVIFELINKLREK